VLSDVNTPIAHHESHISRSNRVSSRPSDTRNNVLLSMSMMSMRLSMSMSEENETSFFADGGSASIATATTTSNITTTNSIMAADASDNTTNNSTSTANAATVEESVDSVDYSIDVESENNEHLNDLNYNPRIVPCPGYESSNLQGYITLEALNQDMRDYYQATNRIVSSSSSSSENNGTRRINIFIFYNLLCSY
jgi:hypothetical protein